MRIFFAVPRSAWVDLNLRRSLEDMGHQLVRFDFPGWPDDADPTWQRVGKPRTNERLLQAFRDALRTAPVDLFYGYFYSSVVYPETIDLICQSGVPTVRLRGLAGWRPGPLYLDPTKPVPGGIQKFIIEGLGS